MIPLGRRVLMFVVGALVVAVIIGAILGDRGWLEVRRRHAAYEGLRLKVEALRAENAALTRRIEALRQDPYVVEQMAREELGHARPGEIIFLFPHSEDP